MPKKGATSINMKVVATAGKGGGGKCQQHNLRALGLGHEEIQKVKEDGSTVLSSHHILEDLMIKHFANIDMAKLSPEDRKAVNDKFVAEVNDAMASRGLTNKSDDPEDMRVMDHVDPALTPKNDFVILQPLEHYLDNTLRPLVKELTGQKMQNSCTPFKEGVAVIKEDTTIEELLEFGKMVEKEIGWHAVQIYIHHDEGHKDKQTQEWKENHHAHIVFDTIDHNTGKTIQVNRLDLANMQTLLSQAIHMERGENSSDLAHLNMLELKADNELANSRLELSNSVAKLGMNPRLMLVDVINSTIDAKLTDKPNDRTTLNLLRVIGKDLYVNPTKLCADAIFEELKRQPDKLDKIADILNIEPIKFKNLSEADSMELVHQTLLEKAVRCGKTESAKDFRPLLNSAKELNLDLVPVMLNPIREKLVEIVDSPIDRDNNHALFRCVERCKVNPTELLQMAHSQGMADKDMQISRMNKEIVDKNALISMKDVQIQEKDQQISSQNQEIESLKSQLAEVIKERDNAVQEKESAIQIKDDVITKTMVTTGSFIPEVICRNLHNFVEVKQKDPSSITKDVDVVKMAEACTMLDLKPNKAIADFIIKFASQSPESESKVCRVLSLNKDNYVDTLNRMADHADSNHILDKEIIFSLVANASFRELSNVLLEKVDELVKTANESPADMQKLKDIASHFDMDLLSISKHAAEGFSNDMAVKKEEFDRLDVEVNAKTAELEKVSSDVAVKNADLVTVNKDIKSKKEELADLGSMIANSEHTVRNIAEGVKNKVFKSNNDLELLNKSLQIEVKDLKKEVATVKQEGKDNQHRALENLRDVHDKETYKLRNEISDLKDTVKSQTGQIAQLKAEKTTLESDKNKFKSKAESLLSLLDPAKRLLLDIGYAAKQVVSIFKGEKVKLFDGQKLNWEGHGKYTAKEGDTSHLVTKDNGDGTLYINDKIYDNACKEQERKQSQHIGKGRGI